MTSFDDSLEQAVRAHQAAYNIEDASVVKGEVGTLTWASLLSQCKLVPFAGSGSSGSGGRREEAAAAAAAARPQKSRHR